VLKPFERSAEFYDALYEGKDYGAEAGYVDGLIQRCLPGARSLLDLGCGTGRHGIEFAKKGYTVLGIDRRREMLARAEHQRAQLPSQLRSQLEFRHNDIRGLRLDRRFDCVVALFHVLSYQNSNEDVVATLMAAKAHTQTNGVFVFDCWYGPGVLSDPPAVRVKRLQIGSSRLIRIAEPIMRINENVVDVHCSFVVAEGPERGPEFNEIHRMRYFFAPELAMALEVTGLKLVALSEWMTDRAPDKQTWNITVVAQSR
jgi:SAM-dependent methyltransferase